MEKKLDSKIDNLRDEILDQAVYEAQGYEARKPIIYSIAESVEYLLNSNDSLARYGDGEVALMGGRGIAFQEYDSKLSSRLQEIAKNNQEGLNVALARYFYYSPNIIEIESRLLRDFYRIAVPSLRRILSEYINFDKFYLNTSLSSADNPQSVSEKKKLWESVSIRDMRGGGGVKAMRF